MAMVAYKCPNCGGPLAFTPDENGFRCEYCMSFFTEQELKERYKDLDENLATQEADAPQPQAQEGMDGAVYYNCPGCGAEIITEENTAATFCYYCHSPVVLGGRLSGNLKPDMVLPFAFSREQAIQKFKDFCGKKKFLPKGFLSDDHIEKMTGIYFPYWLTDGELGGTYVAKGEKVRTWRTGDEEHTETKIYRLTRKGDTLLKFLPVSASKSHDKVMMKYIHPFDNSKLTDFSMTYLSGFQADKRDLELAEAQRTIDADLMRYTEELMKDTIKDYSSVRTERNDMRIKHKKSKYALLPAWVLTYNFNDKVYVYALNGQSGKTFGELPFDKGKLALASVIFGVAATAVSLIVGYLL